MNVDQLKESFLAILEDELGTYQLDQGDCGKVPSLTILDSGQMLPSDRKVSGLEVVIRRIPSHEATPIYGGAWDKKIWTIHLIQRKVEKGELPMLDHALQKVFQSYPQAKATVLGVEKNFNIREQVKLTITDLTDFLTSS